MLSLNRLFSLVSFLCVAASSNLFAQAETPATVPASLVGTYALTYESINAGGPFANGEAVTVVVGSDSSLCVNGASLTNPVLRNGNPAEGFWTNSGANLQFSLSDLSGVFNEINVGNASPQAFLGQLKGSKTSNNSTCSATSTSSDPVVTELMTQVFALAETKLPEFFPGGAITLTLDNYVYRFYQQTSVYLAVADGAVFLLGGAFGDAIVNAGPLSTVLATLETYETPTTGGTAPQPPAATLWNLTISGSFNSSFLQNIDFAGINVANIPAPDLNDTNAITSEINSSLAGVASGISSIAITVVNNSESRRTFDVSFNANLASLGAVTYNLRYDYTR
jgi:hypothetical protein